LEGRVLSTTRPWVDAFADEMEAKLDVNRLKGDRAGWRRESRMWLAAMLLREVAELVETLDYLGRSEGSAQRAIRKAAVRSECADVANFAMMIADVAGGLRAKDAAGGTAVGKRDASARSG
jgi:NTP pyrophosphatase (non-canonical NTP hydrolase)